MTTPADNRFTLLDKPTYITDLCRRLDGMGRGDRAALACMTFDPSKAAIAELADAMAAAARRGVHVHFVCDAINFLTHDDGGLGPLFWRTTLHNKHITPSYKATYDGLQALKAAGVHTTLVNMPGRILPNPIAGRSHIKYAVMNNRVYIGGVNFDYPTHVDIMCAWDDKPTADWLYKQALAIGKHTSVRRALGDLDIHHSIDANADILLDVGVRGQSLIFDTAIQMINQANRHIYLTSQYFPSHATTKHLAAAVKRGVKVRLIYNDVSNVHRIKPLHQLNYWLQKRRLPAQLFEHGLPANHPYMHAKILATEQGAMIGSHNYVTPGVRLGTAEIAFKRMDPSFATHISQWFEQALQR